MARARNIKPGLFMNDILGEADPMLTLLFVGLWTLADREGRLEDRPARIKGELFPYRDGLNVEEMLSWLAGRGFIERYTINGQALIQILQFAKHQSPHGTEKDSDLPDRNGLHTVHARGKNGYATGEVSFVNRSLTVKELSDNTLIPDSGFLIPDSGFLIPDPLNSLPNGKGADAPSLDQGNDAIWDVGVRYLVAKGNTERGARGFLGKMRKHLQDDLVAAELIAAAQKQDVADPIPWLRAAAQRRASTGRTKSGVAL
jgi:hypothetical protein